MGDWAKRWIFWNNISWPGCKWSSLNSLGSETPVSHSLLESLPFPFSAPAPSLTPLSGVISKVLFWEAGQKGGICLEQYQFYKLQMVQFECPRVRSPQVSLTFIEFPFPIFSPCSFPPSSLWGNKKLFIMGGWAKNWQFFLTISVQQVANGPVWMPQGQKTIGVIQLFGLLPFLLCSRARSLLAWVASRDPVNMQQTVIRTSNGGWKFQSVIRKPFGSCLIFKPQPFNLNLT